MRLYALGKINIFNTLYKIIVYYKKVYVHCGRNKTFGRGKKVADNKGETKREKNKKAQSKKGQEQKGHRAKRAQNKKGSRSRCCVTVTYKVVIPSDNRVLSQSFFFFFFVET